MMTVDTSSVMSTVFPIEKYLGVGSSNRPVCRAVGEEKVESDKLNN